jgi:hypothetical protein
MTTESEFPAPTGWPENSLAASTIAPLARILPLVRHELWTIRALT